MLTHLLSQVLAVCLVWGTSLHSRSVASELLRTADKNQKEFCAKQYPKPVPHTRLVKVNNVNIYVYEHLGGRSDIVSDTLLKGNSWEGPEISNLVKAMKAPAMKPEFEPALMVDVGANIGWMSLSVASAGFKVISVEALHDNLMMLRNSLCANTFKDNVVIVAVGLGSANSTCYMFAGTINMGDGIVLCGYNNTQQAVAHLPPSGTNDWRYILRGVTRIRRMDEIFGHLHIKVWKMDVEGYEPNVIGGATKLLENQQIQHVMTEINGPLLYYNETTILYMLTVWERFGYRVSTTGFDGPWLDDKAIKATSQRVKDTFNIYVSLDPSLVTPATKSRSAAALHA